MKPKCEFFKSEDFDPGIGPADDGKELCTYQWAARVANSILSKRGTVVYGNKHGREWDDHEPENGATVVYGIGITHTAYLVGVTPIQRDTAESLLREWVEQGRHRGDIFERAKKLLENK